MTKIWCLRTPALGSAVLMSVLSHAGIAAAAEPPNPASQSFKQSLFPADGIATPDQAVRRMAAGMVVDSRTSAAAALQSPFDAPNRVLPAPNRSIVPKALPNQARAFNNCPNNVCFIPSQPPVSLGTAAARGISPAEQSKLVTPPDISSVLNAARQQPVTPTPNDPIATAAKVALTQGVDTYKEQSTNQIAAAPAEKSVEKEPKTSEIIKPVGKSSIGADIQQQFAFLKDQIVAGSQQFITILPKPQIDISLLNIGKTNNLQAPAVSFSPRLTLGGFSETQGNPVKSLNVLPSLANINNVRPFGVLPAITKPASAGKAISRSNALGQQFSTLLSTKLIQAPSLVASSRKN
jgi:hypothetical protein